METREAMVIDLFGVHVTPDVSPPPSNDVGISFMPRVRCMGYSHQFDPPIAAATRAPAEMPVLIKYMDVNDIHVSYAPAHPGIFHETARKLGFHLAGGF